MALFGKKKYTLVKVKKKDIPAGLWSKCPECDAPTYKKEFLNNLNVCPKCDFHLPLTAQQRINLFIDEGTFKERDAGLSSLDPLEFKGPKTYKEKLEEDQKRTGLIDSVVEVRLRRLAIIHNWAEVELKRVLKRNIYKKQGPNNATNSDQ